MNIITIVPVDRERNILPINQVSVRFYNTCLYLSKRSVTVVPKGLLKEEDERGNKVVLPRTDSTGDPPIEEVGDILSKVDYFSDDVYVIADYFLFKKFSRISNSIIVYKHDIYCSDSDPRKLDIDVEKFEELARHDKNLTADRRELEYHRRIKYSQLEYDLVIALSGKNIEMGRFIHVINRLDLCKAICRDCSDIDYIIKSAGEMVLREISGNGGMTINPSMVTKELDLVPSFGYKDVVLNKEDYVDLDRKDAEIIGDTLYIRYNHTIPLQYTSECGGSIWKKSHLIDFLCKKNREKIDKV